MITTLLVVLCNEITPSLMSTKEDEEGEERKKISITIETQVEFNSEVIISYWCKLWDKIPWKNTYIHQKEKQKNENRENEIVK